MEENIKQEVLDLGISTIETNQNNPWDVLSIEEFNFYNCPECEFKHKSAVEFRNHAVKNHIKAKMIWQSKKICEKLKAENSDWSLNWEGFSDAESDIGEDLDLATEWELVDKTVKLVQVKGDEEIKKAQIPKGSYFL